MSIQQSVTVMIPLVGDGTSTTFTYAWEKLFQLLVSPYESWAGSANFINPTTIPTSAQMISPDGILPSGTASLDGFGNLVLTFNSSWTAGVVGNATIQLFFNSGTLAGTTSAWTSATATNTTWTLPINNSPSCLIPIVVLGTVSVGVISFQVSADGANWFTAQGITTANVLSSTWSAASGSQSYLFNTSGYSYLRMVLTTPITGSGTVTFIIQSNNFVADAMTAVTVLGTVPVSGTFFQATQHVSGTVAVSAVSGSVTVAQATAANLNATVVGGTLTKGTQGATGFSVQDLKDSGRTYLTLTATAAAGVITTEAMLSMSQNKGGTVTAAQTSYTITSGKTLRIQNISISVRAAAAAVPFSRVALRSNTAGATVAGSALVVQLPEVFGISATSGVGGQMSMDFPDGLEIAGNGTVSIGLSHLDQATTNIINITLTGYEY